MNLPSKPQWRGPCAVVRWDGALSWSHGLERPEQVASHGVALASALRASFEQLNLARLEVISIQSKSAVTLLMPEKEAFFVAHQWAAGAGQVAEQAASEWRQQVEQQRLVDPIGRSAEGPTADDTQAVQLEAAIETEEHELVIAEPAADLGHSAPALAASSAVTPPNALVGRTENTYAAKKMALCLCLIEGDFEVAATLSWQIATMWSEMPPAEQREIAAFRAHQEELLAGVRAVVSEDVAPGLSALTRLMNDTHLPVLIRWCAALWLVRGKLRCGDTGKIVTLAGQVHELAQHLDSVARAVSACAVAEGLVIEGQFNTALDWAGQARQVLRGGDLRTVVARTWLVEARVAASHGELESAFQHAKTAYELNPKSSVARMLMAKLAYRGRLDVDYGATLVAVDDAEVRWLRSLLIGNESLRTEEVDELLILSEQPSSSDTLQRLREYTQGTRLAVPAAELLAIRLLRLGRYAPARMMCEYLLAQLSRPERRAAISRLLSEIGTSASQLLAGDAEVAAGNEEPVTNTGVVGQYSPNDSVFSGDLGEFNLPELLEFLRVGRRSGTLICRSGSGQGALRLSRGNIVEARCSSRPHSAVEHLGNLTSRSLADEALAVLTELVRWTDGQFYFEPSKDPPVEQAEPCVDTQWVLLEVFKRMDESEPGRSAVETGRD